jgi:short-subunit dehydrogenase
MTTIKDSIVLITGANGGIGQALVAELLKRGAAKIYLGARNTASLEPLLATSDKLVAVQLDVTDAQQVAKAAAITADTTLLINNAGVAAFTGALSAPDAATARQEMDVNYFGTLALSQALRGAPVFQKGGAVINILSFLAHVTLPVAGTYSASKAAAQALTRTLRAELKPRGVQVLASFPVQTETTMGVALPEPRLTPAEVAIGTLDALEAGEDEVFPGALSQGAAQAFHADPVGMQAQFAQMAHALD